MQFHKLGPDGIQTVKVPQWLAVIIGLGVVSLSLALVVLAASFALILLPVLALAGLIYGWWFRRKLARSGVSWPQPGGNDRAASADIIDGEFIVIEKPQGNGSDAGPPRSYQPGTGGTRGEGH